MPQGSSGTGENVRINRQKYLWVQSSLEELL